MNDGLIVRATEVVSVRWRVLGSAVDSRLPAAGGPADPSVARPGRAGMPPAPSVNCAVELCPARIVLCGDGAGEDLRRGAGAVGDVLGGVAGDRPAVGNRSGDGPGWGTHSFVCECVL